jgi:hypothetical protein
MAEAGNDHGRKAMIHCLNAGFINQEKCIYISACKSTFFEKKEKEFVPEINKIYLCSPKIRNI